MAVVDIDDTEDSCTMVVAMVVAALDDSVATGRRHTKRRAIDLTCRALCMH
jgi:hypothetical protein